LDGCYADVSTMPDGYARMSYYLNQTGRPMVFSCSWPAYEVGSNITPNYPLIAKHCNLWRNYDDIEKSWNSVQGIINWYDKHQDEMIPVNGPGRWNDPDMIIVGARELTVDQSRAQMAIWAIWSAPLLMSNDLRDIDPAYKAILQNRKVIAVNQDPLGVMGRLIVNNTWVGIYLKAMTPVDGQFHSYSIVFFNRHRTDPATVTLTALSKIGLNFERGYYAENLFTDEKYGILYPNSRFDTKVNPTGVVMLKLTVVSKVPELNQETNE